MASFITSGQALTANDTNPGVLNYWIADSFMTATTDDSAIVAFTSASGSGTWFEFECELGEGDFTHTGSAGSGGKEVLLAGNYRLGGLSQAKQDQISSLTQSSRTSIVAEMRDGSWIFLSKNGATFQTSTFSSGLGGAGAGSIGTVVTFAGQDKNEARTVTVATDLATITT